MSEEIEVGEYVRTKNGKLDKVINNEYCMRQYIECESGLYKKDNLVKHNKNIIELIEKNDWVNGQHVKEVKNGYVMVGNGIDGFQVWEEDIRTIVTKEQFKFVEYEIK